MTEQPKFDHYESSECGAIVFEFVQHAIQENEHAPSDIAIGLLKAYLAVLATYAEVQYIPSMIEEACDYLKSVRVMKDGKIHDGIGGIY
jgi:hypothetical protein